jgi:cytochrome oxidase Cu insertion factor (SCO1/SenC/PrrC family)
MPRRAHSTKERGRRAQRRLLFAAPGAIFALLILARGLLVLFGGLTHREQIRPDGNREAIRKPVNLLEKANQSVFSQAEHARAAPAIGGPFRLVSGNGTTVTERDFRGEYLLVYFGYTSCPDVCPTTLNEMAHALTLLGPRAARLQALFITVDPARDRPPLVEKYVARFSPDLIGLTGSAAQIAAVKKEYRVSVAMVPDPGKACGYTIDHTAVLYFMGPDGRFITALRADQSGADLAAAIVKLMP